MRRVREPATWSGRGCCASAALNTRTLAAGAHPRVAAAGLRRQEALQLAAHAGRHRCAVSCAQRPPRFVVRPGSIAHPTLRRLMKIDLYRKSDVGCYTRAALPSAGKCSPRLAPLHGPTKLRLASAMSLQACRTQRAWKCMH